MNRVVVIVLIVVAVLGLAGAGLYYTNRLSTDSKVDTSSQRVVGANPDDIKVDTFSNYSDIRIEILDKNLISTYLNQYDFWNKDIPYYNPSGQVIGKFRMTSLSFILSKGKPEDYPFSVGNLGKFNEDFDVRDQGPLAITIYIDPALVSSLSEEELAKRFSSIAISSINFLTQTKTQNPDAVTTVEPPAPFVKVTRALVTPVASPQLIEDFNKEPEVQ